MSAFYNPIQKWPRDGVRGSFLVPGDGVKRPLYLFVFSKWSPDYDATILALRLRLALVKWPCIASSKLAIAR